MALGDGCVLTVILRPATSERKRVGGIMRLGVLALAAAAAALTVGAALAQGRAADVDAARLTAAERNGEWLGYGRSYSEQRFSPLRQIDVANVGRVGLAWWHEFDTDRGQEATPLMVDGVIYTSTAWSKVYAFDARSGALKWAFDPKVDGAKAFDACCDVVNRGVAVWKGRVYVGALDGRLIALDAASGEVAWEVQTTDTGRPYTITGAPRVVKDKVLIGNGGAEYGVRGYVSAYDADSGELAWRFYTTPNPEGKADGAASDAVMAGKAAATWSGEGWKASGGGGTAWDAMAYDPDLDLLYVGVGNGSPWNHQQRSAGQGDNLFLSSILALRPDTGEYVWHYQTTPGDSWDYTATQHIMLADLPIDGAARRVVMQAPKNGFFYVLDAKSGKLLSAEKYIPVTWAEKIDLVSGRPVESPGARYVEGPARHVTGPLGGHNWQPMAYHPDEGLVFIPAMVTPGGYQNDPDYAFVLGAWNTGLGGGGAGPANRLAASAAPAAGGWTSLPPFTEFGGRLLAWDVAAGKPRWSVRLPQPWNGGVLATAGGLVFQGAGKDLIAYSARDGARLWSYAAGNGIIAAPATYELDGVQYVAVMAGWGGAGGINGVEPRRPGRLLVFKLDGTVKADDYPPASPRPPLDRTLAVASTGDAARGGALYGRFCGHCHNGGYLPNLRQSPMVLEPNAWKAVVHDGALKQNGMAGFSRFMSADDAEAIRAFLLTQAR